MPIQLPNFLNAPIVRGPKYTPDHSGIVNFIPNALEAYNNPFKMRHERMINQEKLKEQAMKNALEERYGPQQKEADIASKLAYANYYQKGGSSGVLGLTPGMRMLNSLPAPDRSALLAKARGLGYTDDETVMAFAQGKTLKDLERASGKSLEETEAIFNPTQSNITGMKNQEGALI